MSTLHAKLAALVDHLGLSVEGGRELAAFVDEVSRTDASGAASPEGGVPSVPAMPVAFAERYQEGGPLGAGGMGEVRRVHDRVLGRSVALKAIQLAIATRASALRRFHREAQLTAQLQHPGIVPVYDLGRLADGRPYFTMREIRGRTLGAVIGAVHAAATDGHWEADTSGWNLHRLVEAFHRVCEAVAYAHAQGVVHRDLKPNNIMIGDYGEVLVVDWGLAKLLTSNEPEGDSERSPVQAHRGPATVVGVVAGTPAYMAPEQARGEAVKPSADVFALGAILYEVLTGQPPAAGQDRDAPTHVPSDTRPGHVQNVSELVWRGSLPVPDELRAMCTRALSSEASDRHADAGQLGEDVAGWLEGTKAQARARALLAQAQEARAAVVALREQAAALREEARGALLVLPGYATIDAKAPAWAKEDRAAALERDAELRATAFTQLVRAALTHRPDLPEAHALLAEHYAAEHARAEDRGAATDAARLEVLLRDHDRGSFAAYLAGDGALTLVTDPPGASAELHRYVLRDRRLQLEPVRTLGRTPLRAVPLPMGDYLVVLRAQGHQDVSYPVQIRRQEHWDGIPPEASEPAPIALPRTDQLAADERYVPGGWFWSGGDAGALGPRSVMPRRRLWLDPFVMQRQHVTIAQFTDFLNALMRAGREDEALAAAPRAAGQAQAPGPLLLGRNDDGTFFVPPNNYFGIPWQPDWPVIFVDWYGASAHARWQTERTGCPVRLPTELEWEKAARGVDGRRYPWGEFLDPTWCRMLESHAGLPTMAPAGTYEVDESPYGIRDLAGNQRDWCMDVPREEGPPISAAGRVLGYHDSHDAWNVRVTRGGNFVDSPLWCWSLYRSSLLPHTRDFTVSFRTVRAFP